MSSSSSDSESSSSASTEKQKQIPGEIPETKKSNLDAEKSREKSNKKDSEPGVNGAGTATTSSNPQDNKETSEQGEEAEDSEKEGKKKKRERIDSQAPMISDEASEPTFILNDYAWSESPVGLSKRQVGLIMVGLMLGLFLASLDQTIVSTALPTIVGDFGRLDLYSWVIIAYLLTSTTTIPISGKLSDIFGRKVCFMVAIVIFLIGSIICGAAPDMITLIVFRAVQGIGGGAIISLAQIIVGDIVSPRQRGKFGGLFGVVWAGSSVLGPILGGIITDNATWRWIFYVNVPIGAISLIVIFFVLKIPGDNIKLKRELFEKIDYAGAASFMAGVVLLLLAVNFGGNQYPWNSPAVILCFILGGLVLIAFVVIELKIPKQPIIPIPLMLQRNVGLCNLTAFGFGWAMFGSISFLPEYFQVVHGDSPTTSGLKLIALMIGVTGASIASGLLISKTGLYYPWPIIGGVALLLGLGLIGGFLTPGINIYLLSFFIFLAGIGIGSVIQTLVITAQFSVDKANLAVATASVAFMRTMGGVVGVAVCGAVLTNNLALNLTGQEIGVVNMGYKAIITDLPDQADFILQAYSSALQYVFYSCMPAVGVAILLAIGLKRGRIQNTPGTVPPTTVEA